MRPGTRIAPVAGSSQTFGSSSRHTVTVASTPREICASGAPASRSPVGSTARLIPCSLRLPAARDVLPWLLRELRAPRTRTGPRSHLASAPRGICASGAPASRSRVGSTACLIPCSFRRTRAGARCRSRQASLVTRHSLNVHDALRDPLPVALRDSQRRECRPLGLDGERVAIGIEGLSQGPAGEPALLAHVFDLDVEASEDEAPALGEEDEL